MLNKVAFSLTLLSVASPAAAMSPDNSSDAPAYRPVGVESEAVRQSVNSKVSTLPVSAASMLVIVGLIGVCGLCRSH